MSGVQHTLKKVSDEALKEMLDDLAEGKSSAEKVLSERIAQAQTEAQRITEQQQRQADALRRQIIGTAEMSARNKQLEVVEENLNASFSLATQKLDSSAKGEDYERVLKGLVLEAIDQVGGSEFVVSGNSRDQELLKGIIEELGSEKRIKVSLGKETIRSIGGAKVRSSDGYVMFDNTFEARLERMKPALRTQIAQLFSQQK